MNIIHGPSESDNSIWPSGEPSGRSILRIPTTPEQDVKAIELAELAEQAGLPYNVLFNNCAHMARMILDGAGIEVGNKLWDRPGKLRQDVEKYLEKRKKQHKNE